MDRKTIRFVFTAHGTISRIEFRTFGDASDDDDGTHSIDFYMNTYDDLLNGCHCLMNETLGVSGWVGR